MKEERPVDRERTLASGYDRARQGRAGMDQNPMRQDSIKYGTVRYGTVQYRTVKSSLVQYSRCTDASGNFDLAGQTREAESAGKGE